MKVSNSLELKNRQNNRVYGYLRVSTVEQSVERQKSLIETAFKDQIYDYFQDQVSGKSLEREGIKLALKTLRKDDILVVESLSRVSRNTLDLLTLLKKFEEDGIVLVSLKEKFDFSSPTGKLMLTLLAALSQFERDLLLERQREGILIAKKAGKYKGRKKVQIPANFQECLVSYLNPNNDYKIRDFQRDTGLRRTLLFRFIREHRTNFQIEITTQK